LRTLNENIIFRGEQYKTKTCRFIKSVKASISYDYIYFKRKSFRVDRSLNIVTLPIGTIIIFHIDNGFVTPITIKSSVLDIEQTEGLCEYINKNKTHV
jgi:hypothetical protein